MLQSTYIVGHISLSTHAPLRVYCPFLLSVSNVKCCIPVYQVQAEYWASVSNRVLKDRQHPAREIIRGYNSKQHNSNQAVWILWRRLANKALKQVHETFHKFRLISFIPRAKMAKWRIPFGYVQQTLPDLSNFKLRNFRLKENLNSKKQLKTKFWNASQFFFAVVKKRNDKKVKGKVIPLQARCGPEGR